MSSGQKKVNKEIKVYGLTSSDEPDIIRYIGQTCLSLNRRLTIHKSQAKKTNERLPVAKWINSKKDKGFKISIVCLKENAERNIDEINYIKLYGKNNLLNCTDGGDGRQLGTIVSDVTKEKISNALKDKKKTEVHIENFRKSRIGKGLWSDERREKFSSDTKGKKTKCWYRRRTEEENDSLAIKRGSKPFLCFHKDTGKYIGRWVNKAKCARDLELHEFCLHGVLSGKYKFTKDYVFRYEGAE